MAGYYIGLMSGTSLDGVDGVVVRFDTNGAAHCMASAHHPMPEALRETLLSLNQPGANELHTAQVAGLDLAERYRLAVDELLNESGLVAGQIAAIGAHGQTVRHHPPAPGRTHPYTLQLNQPAWLAEKTSITVVADFRSRDIAAAGQGAPLVPAFHREIFGVPGESTAIVNLGGIANITAITADGGILGLDTGPGNVLLDLWCHQHTGQWYDADGAWAASGTVDTRWLDQLLQAPYFVQRGLKSTGRDLFNRDWLEHQLLGAPHASPNDVQATLTQLTAHTVAAGLVTVDWGNSPPKRVLVCGGGARNRTLMAALQALLPNTRVATTATAGWPVDQVEAAAFAWLARQTLLRLPGNEPQVTGARGYRILGAIYPA